VLVLTRRAGESIVIGDDVRVVVLDVRGETVRLGIDAPRSVAVHRAEVYAEVQAANAAALAASAGDLGPLAGSLARIARPSRDAAGRPARRMVRMSEGDQRLREVQERIDDAREAADDASEDLLPRAASPADTTSAEGGAFEPSGDESRAGENPEEGPESDLPGEPTR
jgi:carbon storage regulator